MSLTTRQIKSQNREQTDTVAVIETNIDDMSPELIGAAMDDLLEQGAFDVFFTPIVMKKNRPAVKLTVICAPEAGDPLARWLLRNTSTFGVRMREERRLKLEREFRTVRTRFGRITVKIGRLDGKIVSASPEFESCRQAARRAKAPLKRVYGEAVRHAEAFYDR